jgi:hypothetical protein
MRILALLEPPSPQLNKNTLVRQTPATDATDKRREGNNRIESPLERAKKRVPGIGGVPVRLRRAPPPRAFAPVVGGSEIRLL